MSTSSMTEKSTRHIFQSLEKLPQSFPIIGKNRRIFSNVWKSAGGALVFALAGHLAPAATLCVWTNSPAPGWPYNDWTNAAQDIQSAVSAAAAGDTVLVRAGLYQDGGTVAAGALTNRVAITNAITVLSESGPEFTTIAGRGNLGDAAVRCVYVGSNAWLSGFTLSNGFTRLSGDATQERSGGGAWCATGGSLSNCIIRNCRAQYNGGGVYGGTLYHCRVEQNRGGREGGGSRSTHSYDSIFMANTATNGGATGYGTHIRATLCVNTSVLNGGGAYYSTLVEATVSSNRAGDYGGGAYYGALENCQVQNNQSGGSGGGMYLAGSRGCHIIHNVTTNAHGGGVYQGAHVGSFIAGNCAAGNGGGVFEANLTNCTVVLNHANWAGGGVFSDGSPLVEVYNSIVYYNTAGDRGDNYRDAEDYLWVNSCTTPGPGTEIMVTNPPALASLFNPHLMTNSPCRDAGWSGMAGGTNDIDGEPRIQGAAIDIGCDEVWPTALTGALVVAFTAEATATVPGFPLRFQAELQGKAAAYEWRWGDGTVTQTDPWPTHVFTNAGDYAVVLAAWNNDASAASTTTIHVLPGYTNYVSLTGSATPPYESWATAATNIQDAINSNTVLGGTVLVGAGSYSNGYVASPAGRCRVMVDKPLAVRAADAAPGATVILGSGRFASTAVRGVYLGARAFMAGFTISNGFTRLDGSALTDRSGGGAWCAADAVLSNCIIRGNGAEYYGGGVYRGILYDCQVIGNVGSNGGGGVCQSVVHGGVLLGNRASSGGGGFQGEAYDCLVASNQCRYYGAGYYQGTLQRCRVLDNFSTQDGGGTYQTLAYNSLLSGNRASEEGGGATLGELANCTVVNNTAAQGGGVFGSKLWNSIVYYNQAGDGGSMNYYSNYAFGMEYSCAMPYYAGPGNFTGEPGLAAFLNPNLVSNAPCIGAGSNGYALGTTDINGNPRLHGGVVDVGCVEFDQTLWTGTLVSAFSTILTNVVAGYPLPFESKLAGRALEFVWYWGDGLAASNQPALTHAFASAGVFQVTLQARNQSGQSQATTTVQVVGGFTNYVSLAGGNTPPYANWTDAAHVIQDAIDANPVAGGTVLIASGVYTQGGYAYNGMTNRFGITKPLTVMGVDRDTTRVVGQGPLGPNAIRCAYVGALGRLAQLTLTGGCTRIAGDAILERSGGGAWCEPGAVLSNCLLAGNAAQRYGAGVYGGEVVYSKFIANTSGYYGGGACQARVRQSTFEGNLAQVGGGAYESTASGCVFNANRAINGGDGGGVANVQAVDCIFSNNYASDGGGAFNSDLAYCVLTGNTGGLGGAMSGGTLCHSTVAFNQALSDGGGLYATVFSNVLCQFNRAGRNGGGAFAGRGSHAQITGNQAGGHGGGGMGVTAQYCTVGANITLTNGGGAYGGVLAFCEVSGNLAGRYGGGSYDARLDHCQIMFNTSSNSGGGVYNGALTNCLIARNAAGQTGGGARGARLYHCTVCHNTAATNSGGTHACSVYYSISYSNLGGGAVANYSNCTYTYCCTAPEISGVGNISSDPGLVNAPGDDYHLALGSPCIDLEGVVSQLPDDLEGTPRPLDGNADGMARPDMGAYEFLNAQADTDGDWFCDGDEVAAGTGLLDPDSFLGVAGLRHQQAGAGGFEVRWKSVAGKLYHLSRGTNLPAGTGFTNIITGVVGLPDYTSVTDATPAAGSPWIYRIGVTP